MKLCVILLFALFFCRETMAVESSEFDVFYLPLDIDFYIPPSREYIMRNGTYISTSSCKLRDLFSASVKSESSTPVSEDLSGLRVMIVEKKGHNELFLTSDKILLSIAYNKVYKVPENIIDDVLNELILLADKSGDK